MLEILRRKSMGCSPDVQLKHPSSGVNVRERDVDTFLESRYQRLGRRRGMIGRFGHVSRRKMGSICRESKRSSRDEGSRIGRMVPSMRIEGRLTVA